MAGAPGLANEAYGAADILARERNAIFARTWQFVALAGTLATHDDWVATTLGGQGVTIQNFGGTLAGFHNVCAHRQSRLRLACRGNGMLRCPYHGWTYDRHGVPVGIPGNAELFGLDHDARRARALEPIEVARCGNLVFARLEPGGPDLETWLGAFHDPLAQASTALDRVFDEGVLDWDCDWKIGVESAIEGYHVTAVHPDTFRGFVAEALPSAYAGDHSMGPWRLSPTSLGLLERARARLDLAHAEQSDRYDHWFLFPNLMVAVTAGTTLSLQTYEPAGPGRLRLRYVLAGGAIGKPGAAAETVARAFEANNRSFNGVVLEEDRILAEAVQQGRADRPGRVALLGASENRLVHFHRVWRRFMEAQ